jgi:hypothetical protein
MAKWANSTRDFDKVQDNEPTKVDIKQRTRRRNGGLISVLCQSFQLKVFRRFLAAVRDNIKRDLGALTQIAHPRLLNGRDMDEHVLAASVRLDKAVTLGRIKPLHCSSRHVLSPLIYSTDIKPRSHGPTSQTGLRTGGLDIVDLEFHFLRHNPIVVTGGCVSTVRLDQAAGDDWRVISASERNDVVECGFMPSCLAQLEESR